MRIGFTLARRLQRNQAGAAQPGNHPERNNNPHPLDRALQPARRKPAVVMLPPSVPWFAAAQRHLGCPDYARGYRRQLAVMRVRYATAGLARAGAFAPALRYRVIDTPPKAIANGSVPPFSRVPLRCRRRFTTAQASDKAARPLAVRRWLQTRAF
jgi:hypothetical protein